MRGKDKKKRQPRKEAPTPVMVERRASAIDHMVIIDAVLYQSTRRKYARSTLP
jgi:hypothetical protein